MTKRKGKNIGPYIIYVSMVRKNGDQEVEAAERKEKKKRKKRKIYY